jgi:putative PIN family toxin of toxin-antitoxin system
MELCISHPIMEDVGGVLARKFGWTAPELAGFLPPLWRRCIVVTPTKAVTACGDPDDNRVLECAQAAEASSIVTGDEDLLRMKRLAPPGSLRLGPSWTRTESLARDRTGGF